MNSSVTLQEDISKSSRYFGFGGAPFSSETTFVYLKEFELKCFNIFRIFSFFSETDITKIEKLLIAMGDSI